MTPVFLNPPSSSFADLVEQKDQDHQQLKIFINSQYNYAASSSLSSPTNYFFNSSTQDQTSDVIGSQQHDDQKAMIDVSSSTGSQNLSTCQRDQDNINGDQDQYNLNNNNKNMNNGSVKYWMSSKMRLMQKMSNPESSASTITDDRRDKKILHSSRRQDNFSSEAMFKVSPGNNSTTANTAVRVCSDCNTTTTPLWRTGPRGPKSLCNACGIRQRKARRAMAEAAAAAAAATGLAVAPDSSTTGADYYKTQYHIHREKKSRGNHNISHYKNKLKLVDASSTASSKSENNNNNNNNIISSNNLKKFSFGLNNDNYCSAFSGVFPKDVAEAAVLLMELSCGFVQS